MLNSGFMLFSTYATGIMMKKIRPLNNINILRAYGCMVFIFPLFFLSFPFYSHADEVIMKNGDRLSGVIISMTPSSVTVKLPYAGEVELTRTEVAELSTTDPSRLMLADDSLAFGNLTVSSDGTAVLSDSITGSSEKYAFSDIEYLNPPPHISGEGTSFTGEINFGGEFKEGNTVSTKLKLDFTSQYDRGIQRYLFNGMAQWESKDRSKTEDNWFMQGRSNRLFAPKWYTLGNASLEFDEFKGLKLRSVTGGGVGYRFLDQPDKKLSLEGGPSFVYENYREDGKSYSLAFREGANFEYPLFKNHVFLYHNHSILQGITKGQMLSIRTSTGLKLPLGILGIHTAAQLDWNWDKTPSPGRQKSDTTVTLKCGYGW